MKIENENLFKGRKKFTVEDFYLETREELNKEIELDPSNINAYIDRGFSYFCLKDYIFAMEDFNKAIELGEKGELYRTCQNKTGNLKYFKDLCQAEINRNIIHKELTEALNADKVEKIYKVLKEIEFKIGLVIFLFTKGSYCLLDEKDQQTKDFIKNGSIVEVAIEQEERKDIKEKQDIIKTIGNSASPVPFRTSKPITSPADSPKEQIDSLRNFLKNK